ncbi:hypothetical protein JCGZ_20671 [Jatropha curcas]|uniref:AP2/ERF domain-containing protein n=1 Tax=Jatropha curcas TaxID=180498 RepID=A0A067JZT2_JATCU|nr:dehydration-responsive element-binding protein 1A [Jatropha curcas]KDP25515.1 hypothetical protein JCGZ_20671 [Jatropha curcas]
MSCQSSDNNTQESSSSLSDSCSSTTNKTREAHSDEEVLLATSLPKRKAGRRVFKETRHPVYRGVRKRNGNKWVCELREPNKKTRIWLGTYPTPEMAARAHDVAALAFRGKSACLNFADSAWRLPVPASRDAKEIRRAASQAAEMFRREESDDVQITRRDDSFVDSTDSECKNYEENLWFVEEDTIFDMPRLLVDMAQGLLLSPPRFEGEFSNDHWNPLDSSDSDMSLWSY